MAQINHNISAPNDGLGDELRTAFGNQNTMNTDIYANKVDKVTGKGLSSNDFTNTDKAKLDAITAGAEVNVQSDWEQADDTADDYIKNKPAEMFSSVGSFHYVDLATQTTPLIVLLGVEKKITNDTLSTETNVLNAPYGIPSVWNGTDNQLDFSQTSIGDLVTIIPAIEVTTTIANQNINIYLKLGIGSSNPTTKHIYNIPVKTIGSIILNPTSDFAIDTLDIKDYPAEIYILSDDDCTVVSGALDVKVVRKNINVIDLTFLPDSYTNVVYVDTTNPNTATIFDDVNPPVSNDPLLDNDTANLYIGTDSSTWVYNGSIYTTKVVPESSNFYLNGTTVDAGNNKTSPINRSAPISIMEAGDKGISVWKHTLSFWKYVTGVSKTVNVFIDNITNNYSVQFPDKAEAATETFAMVSDLDDKVDKVTGKSLIDDTEISRLASMTAIFTSTLKTAYDSAVTWIATNGAGLISNSHASGSDDETTASIQTKRPLKTVNGNSLEGTGDVTIAGGGGVSDLSIVANPTNNVVSNTNGTGFTVPLADATNAGLIKPAKFTVLENTTNTNSGDETTATIKTKLGISTLSGSNTGDETTASLKTKITETLGYAAADETTAMTTGLKTTFRMPFAMTLTSVRMSLTTAPTISSFVVDVKQNGTSIFSTLVSIDATELTSTTAATPAVITTTALTDDAEITIHVTQIGSGVAGAGLKVLLIGNKS